MNFKENLKKGALNLILNCAELSPHKKVLIVAENEKFGWYDKFVAKIVQKYCTELEIAANLLKIEEPTEENSYKIQKLSAKYDCIIYFSRLGDLKRFENVHSCKVVMSYARNINMLASQFGTTNYKIHLDFKKSIDEVFINTKKLKISCPSGTDVTGNCYKVFSDNNDVAIKRFPMVVHSPISANLLSGVVVVEKFLTSSGSSFYSPSNIKLNEKVKFYIKNGHIQSIIGNEKDVCNIKRHYDYVSNKFEIKRDIVHSLHCGIHNGLLSESIKSKAINVFLKIVKSKIKNPIKTIGVGDNHNDINMLKNTDIPCLVFNKYFKTTNLNIKKLITSSKPSPQGWADVIKKAVLKLK